MLVEQCVVVVLLFSIPKPRAEGKGYSPVKATDGDEGLGNGSGKRSIYARPKE